ncbi:MAG: ECF transporter S component [Oscillospiraceae bacterium]|jgi:uncharacterized membrane protein|nr:ECF transporter S component [Oscillospiraceae bacterium]
MTTRKLTTAAVLAALIFAVTAFVQVPIPSTAGYANLGDAVIFLAAFLVGGPVGAIAAAIGASLSDVMLGYFVYVPATAIIKAAIALVFWLLARRGGHLRYTLAALVSGAVMVAGYFAFELAVFGWGYAIGSAPFNAVQLAANAVVSSALYPIALKLRSVVNKGKNIANL